jgi:hypothetical protein
VEEAGNRWSKPHVSTPSLQGWMQLRKLLRDGVIMLDVDCRDLGNICDIVVERKDYDRRKKPFVLKKAELANEMEYL